MPDRGTELALSPPVNTQELLQVDLVGRGHGSCRCSWAHRAPHRGGTQAIREAISTQRAVCPRDTGGTRLTHLRTHIKKLP